MQKAGSTLSPAIDGDEKLWEKGRLLLFLAGIFLVSSAHGPEGQQDNSGSLQYLRSILCSINCACLQPFHEAGMTIQRAGCKCISNAQVWNFTIIILL